MKRSVQYVLLAAACCLMAAPIMAAELDPAGDIKA